MKQIKLSLQRLSLLAKKQKDYMLAEQSVSSYNVKGNTSVKIRCLMPTTKTWVKNLLQIKLYLQVFAKGTV